MSTHVTISNTPYINTIDNLATIEGDTSEPNGNPVVYLRTLCQNARDEEGEDIGAIGMRPDDARALGMALIEAAHRAEECAGQ